MPRVCTAPSAPQEVLSADACFGEQKKLHPFLMLAIACLLVNFTFDTTGGQVVSKLGAVTLAMAGAVLGTYFVYCFSNRLFLLKVPLYAVLTVLIFAGGVLGTGVVLALLPGSGILIAVCGMAALVVCGAVLCYRNCFTGRDLAVLLVMGGFLLRMGYILYTNIATRQHDVNVFGGDCGHAVYIEYFYTALRLPDFDPRTVWQFYHPPLHHVIAALWMRVNVALGMSYPAACESVQVLTLFYSSCCMIIGYRLLRALRLRGTGLLAGTAFICLYPSLILMSGSINNDMLSVVLSFAAILTAVQWYQKPGMGRILLCAVCMCCAMMAKLSAATVAPAIAALFLFKLYRDQRHIKKYLLQLVCFGLVCVPLGMWWPVYNLVRWGMPLTYVPVLSVDANQYIGQYSAFSRLFGFFDSRKSGVFMSWGTDSLSGAGFYEYNPFVGMLKTSMFGEFTLFVYNRSAVDTLGAIFANVLFWTNLALTLLVLCCAVYFVYKKVYIGHQPIFTAFFWILAGFVMISYVTMCFSAPHTCTQNFRYTMSLLLVGAVFFAQSMDFLCKKRERALRAGTQGQSRELCTTVLLWSLVVLFSIFCLSSVGVYVLLAFV